MGVMMLAAGRAPPSPSRRTAPDAAEAVEAIGRLIDSGFGED